MCSIENVRRKVLARYPYFGGVAAKTEIGRSEKVIGMESDDGVIYYDPDYFNELDLEDKVFALARELCHIALEHYERGKGKDAQIWKAATEAVVNQLLVCDGFELMRGSIDHPEAIGYDAERYYDILLEKKLAIEMIEENMLHQEGPDEDEDDREGQPGEELEGEQEPEEDESEKPDDQDDEALIEVIESDAGNDDSPDMRELAPSGEGPAALDWRLLLRDSLRHGVDWSMQHGVIEDGIVRPVLEELPIPETEIVVDTSWSVDDDLLRGFLRECRNILRLSKIRVGCFDTVFYGFHDIRTDEDIDELEFPGGGGTDFDVAADAFTMRADNRIVFTDGEADEPGRILDAIWVIYGDEKLEPPGGTVIHIPDFYPCNRSRTAI